jgi:hypothetical protein
MKFMISLVLLGLVFCLAANTTPQQKSEKFEATGRGASSEYSLETAKTELEEAEMLMTDMDAEMTHLEDAGVSMTELEETEMLMTEMDEVTDMGEMTQLDEMTDMDEATDSNGKVPLYDTPTDLDDEERNIVDDVDTNVDSDQEEDDILGDILKIQTDVETDKEDHFTS